MIFFGASGTTSIDVSCNPPPKRGKKTGIAYTPTRVPISFQYAVADIGDVIPSHIIEGGALRENMAFRLAGGVQPRERERMGSYTYIMEQAKNLIPDFLLESADVDSGAPVAGPNLTIEAGTGRWNILDVAYELGKGELYKRELISRAKQYGLDPQMIAKISKPILVRIRTTPIDIQAFAESANVSRTLRQSPSEIAQQDARKLTPELLAKFVPSNTGEIYSRANTEFIRDFMQLVPIGDRGELQTATGELSDLGLRRIRNALLQKAYGDPDIVARIAESLNDNSKNVTGALVALAPRFADVVQAVAKGDLYESLDISKDLPPAVKVFSRLQNENIKIEDYLAQQQLFSRELTPEQEELLKIFYGFSRSQKRLREFLNNYLDAMERHGSPKQIGILAGKTISKLQEIRDAAQKTDEAYVDPTPSLFAPPPAKPSRSPAPPPIPSVAKPKAPPLPTETWTESKQLEQWPELSAKKAESEAEALGQQAYFVEGPRGGYRGTVLLSDVKVFLELHPKLRLKPIQ